MPMNRPTAIGRPILASPGSSGSSGPFFLERRIYEGLSATDKVPTLAKKAVIRGIGGGGGGSGGTGDFNNGFGGGGGAFAKTTLKVTPGDTVAISAGTGGKGGRGSVNTGVQTPTQSGADGTASRVSINGNVVLNADFGRGAVYSTAGFRLAYGGSSTVCVGDFAASGGNGGIAGAAGGIGTSGGFGGSSSNGYAGGGGGAGGERVAGNIFDLMKPGNGGKGGFPDPYQASGQIPGGDYGGGGGGGTYINSGSTNTNQIGSGGDGGIGAVVIEYYGDTYVAPIVKTTDIVNSAFAVASSPYSLIGVGLTGDGAIKDLGTLPLITNGVIGTNAGSAKQSPDGNWLVIMFTTQVVGGVTASPLLQIFKKSSSPIGFIYVGTATVPTPYDLNAAYTVGNSGTSVNNVVSFSADSTEFTIPYNTSGLRVFYKLNNGVWSYVGSKANFTGGAGLLQNGFTSDYRESANGLVKLEMYYQNTNTTWYVGGINRNTPFLKPITDKNSLQAYYYTISPTGRYFIVFTVNFNTNRTDVYTYRFNDDGTIVGSGGLTNIIYNPILFLLGPIVWLTETRYVFLGYYSNGSSTASFFVCDIASTSTSITSNTITKVNNLGGESLNLADIQRLDDNNFICLVNTSPASLAIRTYIVAPDGTATRTSSKSNLNPPAGIGYNYQTFTYPFV